MSPITHLLASWVVGAYGTRNQKDCRLVAVAGLLPDADGLGMGIDIANGLLGRPDSLYYAVYHHYLFHGIFGAVLFSIILGFFAREKLRVVLLALLAFHLHLLCDLIGSRGPALTDLWPIYYLGPLTKNPMWIWKGQWALEAWQNRVLGTGLLFWCMWLATQRGHSVVEVFNAKADAAVVKVLRQWRERLGFRSA